MSLPADLREFFEERVVGGRKVPVVIKPLPNREQARRAFPYRGPDGYSRYAESRFGGGELVDDVALLINGIARRCCMCNAPTCLKYLENNICPDCDGRAAAAGHDPTRPRD